MNKVEHNEASITAEVLAAIGADQLVYVRPIEVNGQKLFGIFSAGGEQMAAAPSREVAFAFALQNGVEPMSVH